MEVFRIGVPLLKPTDTPLMSQITMSDSSSGPGATVAYSLAVSPSTMQMVNGWWSSIALAVVIQDTHTHLQIYINSQVCIHRSELLENCVELITQLNMYPVQARCVTYTFNVFPFQIFSIGATENLKGGCSFNKSTLMKIPH